MDIIQVITRELNVEKWQVEAAVKLIDEGCTIPFISRYRKEATGTLNDEQLRNLNERLTYLRNLEDKKAQVLGSIEEQGKLTPELKKQIEAAQTLVVVEDLYRPYRPKRRTRAIIAREKGLGPLADIILLQMTKKPLEEEAKAFLSEEKEVKTVEEAISGARDIIAEHISDEADYRISIRKRTMDKGTICSTARDEKEQSVYEMYYDFEEPVKKLAGHRVLALNRGEKEKFLTVKILAPEEEIIRYLEKQVIVRDNPYTTPVLKEAIEDSYKRLIGPAIEREIRSALTEAAEDGAIHVFGKNLEQLLMQPPIAGQVVLGWDPAFRTGCKLAVVDPTGKVLDGTDPAFLPYRCIRKAYGNQPVGCFFHAHGRTAPEQQISGGNCAPGADHCGNVYTGKVFLPVSLSHGSSICNHADYSGSTFQKKSSKLCAKVYSL